MALVHRATSSKGKDCRGAGEGQGAQPGKMTIPIALSIRRDCSRSGAPPSPEPRQNVMFVRRPITSSFLIFCVGSLGLASPAPGLKKYWMSG
jgi:hypothetical protein